MDSIIIQHVKTSNRRVVTHFELTNELMQNNIHLFKEFHGVQDFHDAFFDPSHENHDKAQEILSVIRPDQIYESSSDNKEAHWVSGEDVITNEELKESKPLILLQKDYWIYPKNS